MARLFITPREIDFIADTNKELIKDVKTLLAEYHEDAKVVRDVK